MGLALWLDPSLVLLLVPVWLYLGLMSKEFFARKWLKARPFTYMWTHMLIMPLIDLYATSCEWMVSGVAPPKGLAWFLLVSFFNGIVIEIGRKIRAPEGEAPGVETYTVLWGRRNAVLAWLGAMLLAATGAFLAARRIAMATPVVLLLGTLLTASTIIAWCFLRQPAARQARLFEPMAGLWTLCMYLGLGAVPLLVRV